MALYIDLKVGECLQVGGAQLTLVEKRSRETCRFQIEADKEEYPVTVVQRDQVERIWEGPPIFATKQ